MKVKYNAHLTTKRLGDSILTRIINGYGINFNTDFRKIFKSQMMCINQDYTVF